jgi:hypothetical protein
VLPTGRHAQRRIHVFDGAVSFGPQLKEIGLSALEKSVLQIWLVPHLEIPILNYVEAVALDHVVCAIGHQITPRFPVFRQADAASGRKDGALSCRHVTRHERRGEHRADADVEQ